MRELARIGTERVIVNTHHLPGPVNSYLAEVSARLHLDAKEFYEPKLLGSAGTVSANPDLCGDADCCLLIYADNLSNVRLDELVAFHREQKAPMTMMLFHTSQPKACGIASMDDSATVVDFVEKPQLPQSNLANGGIYVISREAYREIVEMDSFDFGFDVLPRFIGRMKGKVHRGLHMDIGTLGALERAQEAATEYFGAAPFSDTSLGESGALK
jgi:mannose-1-phosphate guanylyltransferase